jgi:hypothetical protein
MKPFGVHVVLVEPGSFETEIWGRNAVVSKATLGHAATPDSPDAKRLERWRRKIYSGGPRPNPEQIAESTANILNDPKPRLRYLFGRDAWKLILLRTLLPWSQFEQIVIRSSGASE